MVAPLPLLLLAPLSVVLVPVLLLLRLMLPVLQAAAVAL